MGCGIIARMPLQFSILTGKFDKNTRFDKSDHRSFRLTPPILGFSRCPGARLVLAENTGSLGNRLAMSFITSFPEVSYHFQHQTAEQAVWGYSV